MQASQRATQQAMDASRQAAQSAQIAMQNTTLPPVGPSLTATPKFSLKQGAFSAPVTVKIQDRTRGAIIYYTTDGWTPTINSPRYKGPITIDSNARIQAIAIAPYALRSWVATARYAVQPSKRRLPPDRFRLPRKSLQPYRRMANSCFLRALQCDLSLPRR